MPSSSSWQKYLPQATVIEPVLDGLRASAKKSAIPYGDRGAAFTSADLDLAAQWLAMESKSRGSGLAAADRSEPDSPSGTGCSLYAFPSNNNNVWYDQILNYASRPGGARYQQTFKGTYNGIPGSTSGYSPLITCTASVQLCRFS